MENLCVRPGAEAPLPMSNGIKAWVSLLIESELKNRELIHIHPTVNDRTLGIEVEGLQKLFNKIKLEPVWVALD